MSGSAGRASRHCWHCWKIPASRGEDNLVAFLAHLAGDEATASLLSSLSSANNDRPLRPSDERALLLVPQALGHIASRGGAEAMDALLSMSDTPGLADDLLEQATVGLSLAGTPGALEQLNRLAGSTTIPDRVRRTAEAMVFVEWTSSDMDRAANDPPLDRAPDINASGHRSGLTVANHVGVPLRITDAGVDRVLDSASQIAGRSDFAADVSVLRDVSAHRHDCHVRLRGRRTGHPGHQRRDGRAADPPGGTDQGSVTTTTHYNSGDGPEDDALRRDIRGYVELNELRFRFRGTDRGRDQTQDENGPGLRRSWP